ncbi:MAG: hypothetical protein KAJ01_02480 [Candidatus Hydrogenedentes bacterium]|nr:hypothetical protein [Candidatus Hydrogenedentota bacterium]
MDKKLGAVFDDTTEVQRIEVRRQATHPPKMNLYRIEALRAASRIVAGICVSGSPVFEDKKLLADEVTILIAEQFAKYLETGET